MNEIEENLISHVDGSDGKFFRRVVTESKFFQLNFSQMIKHFFDFTILASSPVINRVISFTLNAQKIGSSLPHLFGEHRKWNVNSEQLKENKTIWTSLHCSANTEWRRIKSLKLVGRDADGKGKRVLRKNGI